MAINNIATYDAVKEFLEAWGIVQENILNVTIHMSPDDHVHVSATYLLPGDTEELNKTMTKHYALVELKNE